MILGESSFIEFSYLRQILIRIPEVSDIVASAQKHWDTLRGVKSIDLNNSFYNSDEFFNIHPEFKNFLTDLVQFALFQRLRNQGNKIEYVYSNMSSSRAHLLVLKLQTLKEFVIKHPAVRSFNKEPRQVRALHAVHISSKYSLYRFTSCGIKNIRTSAQASEVFNEIDLLKPALQVLNLGLGQNLKFLKELTTKQQFKIVESVSLDEKLKPIFQTFVSLDPSAVSLENH